jgi:hypothetical protein
MPTLLGAFFGNVGQSYPFLSHAELDQKLRVGLLSPALANAIAAVAVGYVLDSSDLTLGAFNNLLSASAPVYLSLWIVMSEKPRQHTCLQPRYVPSLIA